ncbi:MAG: sensor histidine kinase [Planctomycetota bacterium]|jgi:signal transduction histidine kinase
MEFLKHGTSTMRTRSHHKQVILFLIAVVLPSAVLVVLTWHMIGQQQELSEKRLADERRRMAAEIGRKVLVHLEEIKLHEVSATASGARSLNTLNYTSPEVILTGLADGERLLLPWEANQTNDRLSPDKTAFFEKIRRAEEEEFSRRRFAQANTLYLECIAEARLPAQQAYAQLLRARVLAKSDQVDESLAQYRKVLEVSSQITDEHGIPFCLYAAGNLLESGYSYNEVMQLIASELGAQRWLSPAESYIVRDLVNVLIKSGPEPGIRQRAAGDFRQRIRELISRQEEALALQKNFPKLALMAQWKSPEQEPESIWVLYGEGPWLVSLAPASPAGQRLAIIVRGESILDSITSSTLYSETTLANVRFTTDAGLDGESLGPSFPGLRLAYTTDDAASLLSDWDPQRSFYLIALLLVLCVTLFGAYFLWRDVGRELRMSEMRSQFIASVSHELKTPLTAIRVFAETLRLGRPEDPQAKSEYLDTIVNESHRLTRLLNNVLDFSKIEKGKRTYHREPACLSEIIDAAAQATQYPLKQQDFHLNVHVEEELPQVRVDRDAIGQAILNLLSNAMKYSGESRQIDLRVGNRAGHAVIEVSDRGLGIEPAQQKRIFEKFYRVPSEENQRIPGTGLGLALVFHIVKAHDGHVELRSAPGEGSTFSIHLPLECEP